MDIGITIAWLVIGLTFALLMTCFVIVHGKTAVILETFGKPHINALLPGFHFKGPWPITRVVGRVNLQTQEIASKVEIKTKDNVFMSLPVMVQLRASSQPQGAVRAFYELENPLAQIQSYVLNNVRQCASRMEMSELFSNRDLIESEVQNELSDRFSEFGFLIENVLVDQPQPSPEVELAFNKVIASQREKDAATNLAEAKKIELVGIAAAEAESKRLQGEGIAAMRKAIAEGMKEAMTTMKEAGLQPAEAVHMILEATRLDTLESASKSGNVILMDIDKSSKDPMSDVVAAVQAYGKMVDKSDH